MNRIIGFTIMLTLFSPAAQAENLLSNWLDGVTGKQAKGWVEADGAELLTLEDSQSEMYPKVSPDGKYLLVVSTQKHSSVITKRLLENGDPIAVVSDNDPQALDSIAWWGNDEVVFLSHRAESLGVWKKPVNGGAIKQLKGHLGGELRDPVLLEDGSIIAVRLQRAASNAIGSKSHSKSKKYKLTFDNWAFDGRKAQLVKIDKGGVERVLAPGVNPALSPDGKRVVFSMQAGRSWHLFVMNVDGSELVELTEGRSIDVQPAWSPDGRWVVFTSNRAETDMRHTNKGNWDVWMVAQDGRNMVRLTTDKARDGAANFAENGRVYFHSDRKLSKQQRAYHQVNGAVTGFHIWSVLPPMIEPKR